MYEVTCYNNEGFEDSISVGNQYYGAIENASIHIEDDNGNERTYGMAGKFTLTLAV